MRFCSIYHTIPLYHTCTMKCNVPMTYFKIGNMQDLSSPDKTSSEILVRLLNSPVILHLDKSIIVNPLYKSTHYNSNILYNIISYAQNGYIILICTLYNSKFSLTSKFLERNAAFVNRIHCITIISSILIIYYYYDNSQT